MVDAVSPRAIDKRARPGNEVAPAPVGPLADRTAADFAEVGAVGDAGTTGTTEAQPAASPAPAEKETP